MQESVREPCVIEPLFLSLGKPGDRIIVVVQKSRNLGETGPSGGAGSVTAAKVRRGDIRHAIVVRTTKKVQRPDGMVVKFDDNACALIGKNGEPIGTRINGESLASSLEKEVSFSRCHLVGRYKVPEVPRPFADIPLCRSRGIGASR